MKRTAPASPGVLLVVAIAFLGCSRQEPAPPAAPPAAATSSRGVASGVLLNEILFAPAAGQPSWIELINAGSGSTKLDGFVLQNQSREKQAVTSAANIGPGEVLLIRIDATKAAFLNAERGSVALLSGEKVVDEAFWSTSGGPSFRLTRGGHTAPLAPGTTIGRPPSSAGQGPDAWTIFPPPEATPGKPNAYPAVTGMLPLSGAILPTSPPLSWYSVSTAISYRVQIARDRSFQNPVVDKTLPASGSGLTVEQLEPMLPAGRYLWRVQAIFGEAAGARADFSRPAVFWIEGAAASRSSWLDIFSPPLMAAEAATPSETTPKEKILAVPFIMQRKETALLALEAEETGRAPWDRPWQMRVQPPWCARGSIAMVAAYFGGELSQDRISYEVDKTGYEGPIHDIDVGTGWEDDDIRKGLTFALGSAPSTEFTRSQVSAHVRAGVDLSQLYWDKLVSEIDAGRPVVSTSHIHVWVVAGYREDDRGKSLIINDPARGRYHWLFIASTDMEDADLVGIFGSGVSTIFLLPRNARGKSDEREVSVDSDRDGVMDFDEEQRFQTNPRSKDTDGDGVNDKEDIRAWVFKPDGYRSGAAYPNDDDDRDGKPMQNDEDADGGGCLDGVEDRNGNGKHESDLGESSNFKKGDDGCIAGKYEHVIDVVTNDGWTKDYIEFTANISLKPREDGRLEGLARLTWLMRGTTRLPNTSCFHRDSMANEPMTWASKMEGTATPQPDGTLKVVYHFTEPWPPYPDRWRQDACSGAGGWFVNNYPLDALIMQPKEAVLKDGVYDHTGAPPLGPTQSGTNYLRLRLEQKAPAAAMPPRP
ncbi:MAG: C39 family peptidase [bacterium]